MDTLTLLKNNDPNAVDALIEMAPIDISLMCLRYPEETKQVGYLLATYSEWLMFETAYLDSVLGMPPYDIAKELGLTNQDIEEYQQQWRLAGIEPLNFNFVKSL